MTNLTKYQIALEKAKEEMKLYNAGVVIAEAYQSKLSRFDAVYAVERFLFEKDEFWTFNGLNLTSKSLTHFQFMTDTQKDSELNKIKRAVKLLEEKEESKYYALEAYKDITE